MKARQRITSRTADAQTQRIFAAEEAKQKPKTVQCGPGTGTQLVYDHRVYNPLKTSVDSAVTTYSLNYLKQESVTSVTLISVGASALEHRASEETFHKTWAAETTVLILSAFPQHDFRTLQRPRRAASTEYDAVAGHFLQGFSSFFGEVNVLGQANRFAVENRRGLTIIALAR